MPLGDLEIGFLEDCHEDWRALWEVLAGPPARNANEAIAFITPLVADGYLTTLRVTAWGQARAAQPMTLDDALVVVGDTSSYTLPKDVGETFYLLSITTKGETAIPPDAFPDD